MKKIFKIKEKSNKKALLSFLISLFCMIIAAYIFFYANDAILSFIFIEIAIIIALIKAYNVLEYKNF